MTGPRTLLLLLLITLILLESASAKGKAKPCKFNGQKYMAGEVIAKIDDHCLILKCSKRGKEVEWASNSDCSCDIKEVKDCGQLQPPANGFMTENGTLVRDIIEFGCDKGYKLDGAKEVECLDTGIWSTEVPNCLTKILPDCASARCNGGDSVCYGRRRCPTRKLKCTGCGGDSCCATFGN